MADQIALSDYIKKIVESKGVDVLNNPALFISIAADLCGGDKNALSILRRGFDKKAGEYIVAAINSTAEERRRNIRHLEIYLQDELGLSVEWREKFISGFKDAMDLDSFSSVSEQRAGCEFKEAQSTEDSKSTEFPIVYEDKKGWKLEILGYAKKEENEYDEEEVDDSDASECVSAGIDTDMVDVIEHYRNGSWYKGTMWYKGTKWYNLSTRKGFRGVGVYHFAEGPTVYSNFMDDEFFNVSCEYNNIIYNERDISNTLDGYDGEYPITGIRTIEETSDCIKGGIETITIKYPKDHRDGIDLISIELYKCETPNDIKILDITPNEACDIEYRELLND